MIKELVKLAQEMSDKEIKANVENNVELAQFFGELRATIIYRIIEETQKINGR